ncbi:MAG: superoxide dismutase family protein [Gemmatimonadetes bacterium]|nr:superoxide dismutase family protein [Gemmatimonadota bacterium]
MKTALWTALCCLAVLPSLARAQQAAPPTARAELKDAQAQKVGDVMLEQTPTGLLLRAELSNLTPGAHAFHVHALGKCEPPQFTSAGGHFNPLGQKHGIKNPEGRHLGDLPNIHVGADGKARFELLMGGISLRGENLFDADGSALVVHAAADDYMTDPAGNAGARVACGVVMKQ